MTYPFNEVRSEFDDDDEENATSWFGQETGFCVCDPEFLVHDSCKNTESRVWKTQFRLNKESINSLLSAYAYCVYIVSTN